MTREEAAWVLTELADEYEKYELSKNGWLETTYIPAHRMAAAALREKAERGRGCAYCVIGKRSPDARYCSNCGRKLTPTLPELANESEEVNQDSRQYLDNDSTYRRKSVKQMSRNLYSETAETCTLRGPVPDPDTGLMPCAWCGPERIGRFSVQLWLRASTWKRKWMSVTQQYKSRVKFCPMCGRKLEVDDD